MKLKNAIRNSLGMSLAVIACSMGQTVLAGAGSPMDNLDPSLSALKSQITINSDGTLNYGTCPTGYICSTTPLSDTGFIQMMLESELTGEKIIHTVVADGATGSSLAAPGANFFGTSNFVRIGSGQSAYAGEQLITEDSNGVAFATGFASVNGDYASSLHPKSKIQQSMAAGDGTFEAGFEAHFGDNNITLDGYDGQHREIRLTERVADIAGEFSGEFDMLQLTNQNVSAGYQPAATYAEFKNLRMREVIDDSASSTEPMVQNFAYDRRKGASVVVNGNASSVSAPATPFDAGDDISMLRINEASTSGGDFTFEQFKDFSQSYSIEEKSFTGQQPLVFASYYDTSAGDPFGAF